MEKGTAFRNGSVCKKKFAKRWWQKKTLLVSNLIEVLFFVLREYTAGNPMKINVLWTSLTLVQIREKMKIH
jgi:hypothetical protein